MPSQLLMCFHLGTHHPEEHPASFTSPSWRMIWRDTGCLLSHAPNTHPPGPSFPAEDPAHTTHITHTHQEVRTRRWCNSPNPRYSKKQSRNLNKAFRLQNPHCFPIIKEKKRGHTQLFLAWMPYTFSCHRLILKCGEFPLWRIKSQKIFPRRPRSLISHKWPQGWKKSPKLRLAGEQGPFCLIFLLSFLGTGRLRLRQWKIPKCQAVLR